MPTYVYMCKKCSKELEVFHAVSAKSPEKCAECNGDLKRIPSSGAGIIMKGQSSCPSVSNCRAAAPSCGGGTCGPSPCGL